MPLHIAWQKLTRDLDDFTYVMEPDQHVLGAGLMNDGWKPLTDDFLKLNTDGSFREHANCMGGGGLLRDKAGCWIEGFTLRETGGDPFMAEALALRQGLIMVWNHGHRKVSCDIDCNDLVSILEEANLARINFHPHAPILRDIVHLLSRDWRASVSWVHRDGNKAADWLSKQGHDLLAPGIQYIQQPESELQLILLRDSLVVP